jgi:hypothetical protein
MNKVDLSNPIIHKSHTKAYLMKIIQILDIPIKYNMFNKSQLIDEIDTWILCNIDHEFNTENYLELKNVIDLLEYLQLPAEKEYDHKGIKEKQLLLLKAKQLICFVNNGCDMERSFYKNISDVYHDALLIAEQGLELSSCRRAIFLYNNTLNYKDKIHLKVNKYSMEEMKILLKQKKMCEPIYKHKKGLFNLDFS